MSPSSPSHPESLTKRTVSGTAWSGVSVVGRQLLSFLSVAILARMLPASAYGLLGEANIVTNFLLTFRDLGTATALIQKREVSRELLSGIFWMNFVLGVVLAACVVAVSVPTALFFREPQLAPVMQVLAASFWFSSLGVVHSALLSREMAFRRIAIADLSGAVSGTAVAITLAVRGAGVWSLVFGTLTNTAVSTVVLWCVLPWRPQRAVADWKEISSIASYSLHLSGFGFVNYFSRNADNLIVGRFLGSAQLGYYQMAYSLMLYPLQNVSGVISQVLMPALSKLQDDNARFRSAYLRTCALIGVITFPMMAGLMVVADPFVRVVLGEKWLPVIALLRIFAPLGLIQSIMTTVGSIYMAKGRADWMFRWGLTFAVLAVASFFAGLPWGIQGVALAYAIVLLLTMYPGFAIPFTLIELRIGEFWSALWPQLRIALLMATVSGGWLMAIQWLGVTRAWALLTSTVTFGVISYVAMFYWWKPAALAEIAQILRQTGRPWLVRLGHLAEAQPQSSGAQPR
jgi:O-antigen/teichoic acid export membrane protein